MAREDTSWRHAFKMVDTTSVAHRRQSLTAITVTVILAPPWTGF